MHSWTSYIRLPLKPYPSRASPKCRLPSSMIRTSRYWNWIPSHRTILLKRIQARWHWRLRRGWHRYLTQWLIGVYGVSGRRSRSTKFLSSAYFSLTQDRQDTTTPKLIFLPFLCHLRFFEIHFELDSPDVDDEYDLNILTFKFLMDSLSISLTTPSTLEHLELNIRFQNNCLNPFYENLQEAWSHLDSFTTHSAGSRLKRVDVNIEYSFRCLESYDDDGELDEFDEDELLKSVLDGLPLLRSKGILSVKADLVDSEWHGLDSRTPRFMAVGQSEQMTIGREKAIEAHRGP